MDHKTALKNAIKHQIKAGHFDALQQGLAASEYRATVNEALEELAGKQEPTPRSGFTTPEEDTGYAILRREPPEDDIVPIG